MARIEIYTLPLCPYCGWAKELLQKKNAAFKEIDVGGDATLRAEARERSSGRTTLPQIFIGETHVGGCDDLFALDAAGQLDPLLAKVGVISA